VEEDGKDRWKNREKGGRVRESGSEGGEEGERRGLRWKG